MNPPSPSALTNNSAARRHHPSEPRAAIAEMKSRNAGGPAPRQPKAASHQATPSANNHSRQDCAFVALLRHLLRMWRMLRTCQGAAENAWADSLERRHENQRNDGRRLSFFESRPPRWPTGSYIVPAGSIAPPAIHTTLSALMALSAKPKGIWKSGRRIPDVSQIGYWRDIAVNGLLSSSYHLLEHKMQRALAQKSPLVSPNRNGGDDGPRWHSTHG